MFQSDLMEQNQLKSLEEIQTKENNTETVDKSFAGVNNLIDKMKSDHAQPSQSRLKNQTNRMAANGNSDIHSNQGNRVEL